MEFVSKSQSDIFLLFLNLQYQYLIGSCVILIIRLYVKDIPADSLAASTDLHTGDIIVEFDGEEVYTNDDLDSVLKKKESGDTVEMVVYRADDMGYRQLKGSV